MSMSRPCPDRVPCRSERYVQSASRSEEMNVDPGPVFDRVPPCPTVSRPCPGTRSITAPDRVPVVPVFTPGHGQERVEVAGRTTTASRPETEHFAAVAYRALPALEEMTMSRSKDKGTAWETAICRLLAAEGFPHTERRSLGGTTDRGDIAGIPGWVLEAKNCQRDQLGAWVDEAAIEQANDGAEFSAVWHHRRGKASPADGYVTMTGATFVRLLHALGHGTPPSGPQSDEPAPPAPTPSLEAWATTGGI